MSKLILCIDDEPDRYNKLSQLACQKNIFVATTCRTPDVREYLKGPNIIIGVCLDFEMPFGTGVVFLDIMKTYNIPIAITDPTKYGKAKLKEMLNYLNKSFIDLPLEENNWELEVLKFFGQESEPTLESDIMSYLKNRLLKNVP